MEFNFKAEDDSWYDCIKPLPIEGGFNISNHQAQLAVIFELGMQRSVRIDDIDRWMNNRNNSIGWDDHSILSHHSRIMNETLEFHEYFKLKHKHRGKNLKKFGV